MDSHMQSRLPQVVEQAEATLLQDWLVLLKESMASSTLRPGQLQEECQEFLHLLRQALYNSTQPINIQSSPWQGVRDLLTSISRLRSQQGLTPSETAMFVFSFKQPLFEQLRQALAEEPDVLVQETWLATTLLDKLGLFTTEVFQRAREAVIARQQEELMELSTPVVKLWDGILALPVIGTLDSARTQVVMESLLQKIVDTGSEIAIIDITGVPTVDTLTAQHLLKTVTAARLMGAECIISGIRPQIAQTIVYLGVDLADVTTKASLADAFSLAMKRLGLGIYSTQKVNS